MSSRSVVMGKIVASYGVRGWLKVRTFTDAPDALLHYPKWTLCDERSGSETTYSLLDGREHDEFLVVSLDGLTTREDAAALRGHLITIPRSALPEPNQDEIYFTDLIGLRVINREGLTLGVVDDVREYGAHPVLHVRSENIEEKQAILIPYVAAYIDEVALKEGILRVDWQLDY